MRHRRWPLPCLGLPLLCLVLAACDEGTERTNLWVLYDPCEPTVIAAAADTTAGELASIDAALAMWAAVGLTGLTREPTPGAQQIPLHFQEAAPVFHGLYQREIGAVVINRRLPGDPDRAVTIAHELGHAFGLLHVDGNLRPSVMNQGNLTILPTAEDASALAGYWGCP